MEALANEPFSSSLWNLLPVGIFHTDAFGQNLYANKYLCEMLGKTADELKGDGWKKIIHPKDRQYVSINWHAAARLCLPFDMEFRYLLDNNKIIWACCHATPILNDLGNVKGYIGAIIDISIQKTVKINERNDNTTKEYFELGLESAQTGLWSWDIVNDILVWDKRVYEIFDIPSNTTLQGYKSFIRYVYPEDIDFVQKTVEASLTAAPPSKTNSYAIEFRIVSSTNKIRHIKTVARVHFNEYDKPIIFIGLVQDITAEIENEQRLRQQQNAASNIAYQNIISEMASSLAHELNQPLTAIATYSQLLVTQLKLNNFNHADLIHATEHIAKQAERAGKIIHQVKNSARQKTIFYEETDICQLIDESIELLGHKNIGKLPELLFEAATDLPKVFLDRIQIQQVIINLIKNSAEALHEIKKAKKQIKICAYLEDNRIAITITDNGPGIPKPLQAKIFQPSFTTKKSGLGIGLAICRSIMEMHSGSLMLCHSSKKGTCFKLILPLQ